MWPGSFPMWCGFWQPGLGGWCLSPNHPGNLSQMGSFESSEMEIVAYGRSCAEPIFGSPGCHLFNTSHLDG
jgi:hypothetical protein